MGLNMSRLALASVLKHTLPFLPADSKMVVAWGAGGDSRALPAPRAPALWLPGPEPGRLCKERHEAYPGP